MRHRRGRVRKHQIDELMVLVNRTLKITEELASQPRLMVALDHERALKLWPTNEAGCVAVNIIQMWLGFDSPVWIRVGDSVTLHASVNQVQAHYPIHDDGDEGETGGDRRDPQRAGSAVEGEGGEELVSPSEWFANQRGKAPDTPYS